MIGLCLKRNKKHQFSIRYRLIEVNMLEIKIQNKDSLLNVSIWRNQEAKILMTNVDLIVLY